MPVLFFSTTSHAAVAHRDPVRFRRKLHVVDAEEKAPSGLQANADPFASGAFLCRLLAVGNFPSLQVTGKTIVFLVRTDMTRVLVLMSA